MTRNFHRKSGSLTLTREHYGGKATRRGLKEHEAKWLISRSQQENISSPIKRTSVSLIPDKRHAFRDAKFVSHILQSLSVGTTSCYNTPVVFRQTSNHF